MQVLSRHSSSDAFVAGDRRLTYAHVRDLLSQYVAALAHRGVGLGVGVTMLSPNMPESWIVQAATYLLGGRFTGLLPLASVTDHITVCEDAEATVLGAAGIPVPDWLWLEVDQVVDQAMKDLKRGRPVSIAGWHFKLYDQAVRHLPRRIVATMARSRKRLRG